MFATLYKNLTTPKAVKEEKEAKVSQEQANKSFIDETINNQWLTWLQHPCTEKLMQEVIQARNKLTTQSKQEALNNTNPTITLVKVDTLDKVIAYANHRSPIL